MKNLYEMPEVEVISFATEAIMNGGSAGETPSMGGDVEVWD